MRKQAKANSVLVGRVKGRHCASNVYERLPRLAEMSANEHNMENHHCFIFCNKNPNDKFI